MNKFHQLNTPAQERETRDRRVKTRRIKMCIKNVFKWKQFSLVHTIFYLCIVAIIQKKKHSTNKNKKSVLASGKKYWTKRVSARTSVSSTLTINLKDDASNLHTYEHFLRPCIKCIKQHETNGTKRDKYMMVHQNQTDTLHYLNWASQSDILSRIKFLLLFLSFIHFIISPLHYTEKFKLSAAH